jgi:hypothetical protein
MARPRKPPEFEREELGLPPLVAKQRRCLRCGESFRSKWSGNRLCDACRGKPADGEAGSLSRERIMPWS